MENEWRLWGGKSMWRILHPFDYSGLEMERMADGDYCSVPFKLLRCFVDFGWLWVTWYLGSLVWKYHREDRGWNLKKKKVSRILSGKTEWVQRVSREGHYRGPKWGMLKKKWQSWIWRRDLCVMLDCSQRWREEMWLRNSVMKDYHLAIFPWMLSEATNRLRGWEYK